MQDVYDAVGAVPREGVTFNNVIKPLIDLDGDAHTHSGVLSVSIEGLMKPFLTYL